MQPVCTIVIPVFNRFELAKRAVESARDQNAEIIVVDDGSTDGTAERLGSESVDNRNVRLIAGQHQGAAAARNTGADNANGSFLLFLDSDDELLPGAIEAFQREFAKPNIGVVCSAATQVDDAGELVRNKAPKLMGPAYENVVGLFLAGTFAVRTDVFRAIGGFAAECPANQHKEFALRVAPHCKANDLKVLAIEETTVRIHLHDAGHLRDNLASLVGGAKYILAHHSEQLKKSPRDYAYWCASAGAGEAKLGEFKSARQLFGQACRNDQRFKNGLRWFCASTPLVRRLIWKRAVASA